MSSEQPLWQEIQRGEGKTLELKAELPKGEQLAKTLVAFANTSGGKLVLGVDDQRQVVGVQGDEFDLMDRIASLTHDQCLPTLRPNIYLQTVQGQTLVVVQVYRGNQLPYHLKSKGRDKGTGLGLSICERIVREHGGEMDVESGEEGTVFRIFLPADETPRPYAEPVPLSP